MNNYVTIAIYSYPHEYVIPKLLLTQKNIRFVLENETMINIVPFYSNALGGVHLKVHKEDVEYALKIIKQIENNTSHLRLL